jgi:hypothetical protein
MIDFYETPERQNNIASLATLLCGIGGIVLFAAANYIPYASLPQSVAVVLLVVAVMMAVRWQTSYRYRISEDSEDGTVELCVLRLRGKKTMTLCRLALRDLREIDPVTSVDRKEHKKKYSADKIYNYCPDVLPDRAVYLHFEENGNRIILCLQASEEFVTRMKALM